MPELPEVEITRRGLLKQLKGRKCKGAVVRETRFRKPTPLDLSQKLTEKRLLDIHRRGKYLVWEFDEGVLLSHLGMSGVLRVFPAGTRSVQKHDHIDINFGDWIVRYHDPRRFGFMIWLPTLEAAYHVPEILSLGVEPFSKQFNARYLKESFSKIHSPIKVALLGGKYVVGVGNIYCSESLFRAGINPKVPACKLSLKRLEALVRSIKEVLSDAIEQGGSTLKDFVSAEGNKGYFTLNASVYGREGGPCPVCGTKIKKIIQAERATYFCPTCQKN